MRRLLLLILIAFASLAPAAAQTNPNAIPPDIRPLTSEEATSLRATLREAEATRDPAAAAANVARALEMLNATYGPSHPFSAILLSSSASLASRRGDLASAERDLRRQVQVYDARLEPGHVMIQNARMELSDILRADLADRRPDMIALWRRWLAADRTSLGATSPVVALDMNNLGWLLLERGESGEALDWMQRSLAIRVATDGDNSDAAGESYNNIANALVFEGRFVEAERSARKAVAARAASLGPDHVLTGESTQVLSSTLAFLGRHAESLAEAERALAIVERAQGPTHPNLMMYLDGLASAYVLNKRMEDAERIARRSVSITQSGRSPYAHAMALVKLASVLRERKPEEARALLTEARALSENRFGRGDAVTALICADQANAAWQGGASREALPHARCAYEAFANQLALKQAALGSSAHREARTAIVGASRRFARLAFENGAAAGDTALLAEAFAASQYGENTTVALGAAGSALSSATANAADAQLVNAWKDAQSRAARIGEILRNVDPQNPAAAPLLDEAAQATAARRTTEVALRTRLPRFYNLLLSPAVGLRDAQAVVAADEVLIILSPGDAQLPAGHRRGLVMAVTRDEAAIAEIPLEPDVLETEIGAVLEQLRGDGATTSLIDPSRTTSPFDRARAHRLYQALFSAPQIAALAAGKSRWTLAPQGALVAAPFAALVMSPAPGGVAKDADPQALRQTQWLGLTKALAITPTVASLVAQRGVHTRGAQTSGVSGARTAFFGLGDPAFDGVPGSARLPEMRAVFNGRRGNVDVLRTLPRLSGTRVEIERLAQTLGAARQDYILDVEASETQLKRRAPQLARAEVVVFATHGLIAGDLQGSLAEPALALAPPPQASEADDGLLTASEAAAMRLSARWLILSACNTAAGGAPDAEGLTGLAQAFLYAGAKSLLVTQWAVGDDAAYLLTTRAIALQKSRGVSTAEAMRLSMASLVASDLAYVNARGERVTGDDLDLKGASFAHPSAWAPFVVLSGE